MPSKIGGGSKQMPLLCRPLWWPWWGVEATNAASPDAACLGLHWKPLDAAIGRLLAPYRLGGHQGDSKQNNDVLMYPLWWPFRWPSQCGGTIPRASPDGGGPGLSYKPLNTAIGRALAPIASIGHFNSAICFDVWGALLFCREVAIFT
jgi:hypothetical protein